MGEMDGTSGGCRFCHEFVYHVPLPLAGARMEATAGTYHEWVGRATVKDGHERTKTHTRTSLKV